MGEMMAKDRAHRRVTDLPPDMQSINALNAYEQGRDYLRVACQLSDVHEEVGELAILKISMASLTVEVERVFDEFSMAFHSRERMVDILLETGGIVRLRRAADWETYILKSKFLLDAYSLGGTTDFVFGDEGQIFRFDGVSQWTLDSFSSPDRLFAMHGISPDRLYAAGGNGLLIKANGRNWDVVDVGVGTDFRCLLVENERVLVAGDRGVAGSLTGSEFTLFDTEIEGDILSICAFKGSIYFADSDFGIHRFVDSTSEQVANLGYTYRLNNGEWLTAVCGEYIFQFDGASWRGIEISYRNGYRADPFDTSFIT
ncbi:hypothetical protein LB534_04445 [Mesorhizobium sp. CA18]|uniref:hypothetical protein n=1 Tax=unclassified Mesorhizobium TaxID=325217 RepID=UPI001CCC1C19|nr:MULTISPECIES: hypothetical protein [unclassified Mesorhizobium]MBZ9734247.1 hypothetical protein [Mesorhizobium sp. CA9]MBZ9766972.1 hypothetical protein [Mesorhizobium sp. CA6]MBZ9824528.1 hypothetical protein [Mesorhizobium sp. CA18]MBZ9829514.1 hypothetical protein [Mesorhizobium sp. CA2]MBZ9837213.1 hypothetical protein [Mesorhizobium sp. CA3]